MISALMCLCLVNTPRPGKLLADKNFRSNIAYQYKAANGGPMLHIGGSSKAVVGPRGGFIDLTYSARVNLLYAHQQARYLLIVDRVTGKTVKTDLRTLAGENGTVLQQAKLFDPQEIETAIDPTGKLLYILGSDPIQLWRLNLENHGVELVADQPKLERLIGKKLDWGTPGAHTCIVRVSPSGLIALSLPGRVYGDIDQHLADTYVMSYSGNSIYKCSGGSPILWLSDSKLLTGEEVHVPFIKNVNVSFSDDVVHLVDIHRGILQTRHGYATAVFDGKQLWLLRQEVNRFRTLQSFTYFQGFTQNLYIIEPAKRYVSPAPSLSDNVDGGFCVVWVGPLRTK